MSEDYGQITVRVQANVANKGQVIVGKYLGNTFVSAELPVFDADGEVALVLDNDGSFDKVKVFVFKDFTTIEPLMEAITVGQEDKR